MKRRLVLVALAALVLTGCSQAGEETGTGSIREAEVELDDGRTVTCLVIDGYREAALSCDWPGAR